MLEIVPKQCKTACAFKLTHASMPFGANLAQTIKMGIVVNMPMISVKQQKVAQGTGCFVSKFLNG